MTLGNVIADYRKEHNMSMDQFAAQSGLSKSYISILERNRTPHGNEPVPSIETYQAVAKAIGVDTDELVRIVDGKISLLPPPFEIGNLSPAPALREWPVIGVTACGDPVHDELVGETVLAPENIKADAVFLCHGESMTGARIMDGDYVFIQFDASMENGDICLVRIDDEYTLKRVYSDGDSLRLVAENPTFPTRLIVGSELETVSIVGKAVYFMSKVI